MLHSPSFFKVSKPSLAGISKVCTGESSAPDGLSPHSNYLISCCLHSAPQAHPSKVKGTKSPIREASHGIPAALSPLVKPSTQAVQAHVATSGPSRCLFPPPRRAHPSTRCCHGGPPKGRTPRRGQTRMYSPAAIAGVCGCHRLAAPLPLVGRGCGNGPPKL